MSRRPAESMEELLENPADYGFCTFEEFVENKEKWMGRRDDEISAIDAGDAQLGCVQRYYMDCLGAGMVRLDSLEHGERIAADMGLDFYSDFLVKPQIRKDMTLRQGFYNEVTFVPKARLAPKDRGLH